MNDNLYPEIIRERERERERERRREREQEKRSKGEEFLFLKGAKK